ncbi:hypothetical protein, partial [Liquorilactobacillus hordei]|uniref:hypothetical protein n=1 Tax=Liquorilactobacillus hordei TaxID=468911 RepID=UPI0039E9E8CA
YKLRLDSKETEYIHHQFDEYRSKWEKREIKLNDIKEEYNKIVKSKESKITKPRSIADGMMDEMAKQTKENIFEAAQKLSKRKPEQTKLDLQ